MENTADTTRFVIVIQNSIIYYGVTAETATVFLFG
jgi:hypothetical protein